jgi:hypothetical protein
MEERRLCSTLSSSGSKVLNHISIEIGHSEHKWGVRFAQIPKMNQPNSHLIQVVAATLGIKLYPEPGHASGRSVTLSLKRRGGENLDGFDAWTPSCLEIWLN